MVKYPFHVFIHLIMFSYLCCAHILEFGHDKLNSRATHCVFLGYSRIKMSSRYCDLESHHFYISIDITSLKIYHIS